jgi:Raf kinase inhibitor-like YbhB/YbcL family protein
MKPLALLTTIILAAGMAGAVGAATTAGLAINDPGAAAAKKLAVTSPKIASGGAIAEMYSAYGQSVSPPLHWGKGPYGTRSFALIVEDPDAPMPTPFTHWMVWNLPASTTSVAEGAVPAGARQGKLMFVGKVGYMGPRPPAGGPHHYHFQVFALDQALDLPDGAERPALMAAIKGHVLASGELVGTYQKQ